RTHFDHANTVQRAANARNACRQIEVEQKILPEFLLGLEAMFGDDVAQRRKGVDLAHYALLVMRWAKAIAAAKLFVEPLPVPARSNAVPWSGEVRTMGKPNVTFTASSKATVLIGISA